MCATAGTGPYRKWEKQPLCDELGEASSSSREDDYTPKGHCDGPIVSKKTLQYLIWFNAALFILVVLGGTMMVSSLTRAHPVAMQGGTAGVSCSGVACRLKGMLTLQRAHSVSNDGAIFCAHSDMLWTRLPGSGMTRADCMGANEHLWPQPVPSGVSSTELSWQACMARRAPLGTQAEQAT